ncbi:putative late blight resistance protein homolog R1B-16 [Salvia hispanica]|uniref:putative late blight resistance protein homolog R1B-16 n=1 Tax=Salvia hispanica TaxID=49212 RepID=UPI0020094465|nr:putative late blight resistance protein homolog R1B-16 [Salvia hispanica]
MEDNKMLVGIEEDLMQLKDRLTRMEKKREIVPIVGMGGVGKTTLARKLYEDKLIVEYFHCRAWTTISQDYNLPQILLSLLSCITEKECGQSNDELKDMLYKSLYGRKYLIVLDDIWSTKFWDEIRMYFPDNNNGSRIVITTREYDVANYADSLSSHHHVQLLGKSESWNLLCQLVFGEEECPPELQDIGRKIASDCGGLPLAISVIGGLLSNMERSKDVWRKIGDNVIAAIAESNEQCYSILSLSYNHLPNHLKPCFLYMGAYPEDYEIKGSRLVCLWVAEGFVKSNGERSLEEEAEDWLESLVDRNLFMVRKYKRNGKPKSYSMHDMLRDICIQKSAEDMFLNAPNKFTFSNSRLIGLYFPSGAISAARLLRVLDLMDNFRSFPTVIFEFVNLHFLGVSCDSSIPRGISRLWNLQTLISYSSFDEPAELLKLSELRNLKVRAIELLKDEEMNYNVPKKLQRISLFIDKKEFLYLEDLRIVRWIADETNFPRLRHLHLHECKHLEEIPSGIGEIPTLQLIELNIAANPQWPQQKGLWRSNLTMETTISNFAL